MEQHDALFLLNTSVKRKPSTRVTVASMPRGIPRSYLETDTTLASNSDLKVPSTKAVRAYIASAAGGGSVTLETPDGARDGANVDFVFIGTPILIFRNGVLASPDDYTVIGTTVSFDVAPQSGEITGLTQ